MIFSRRFFDVRIAYLQVNVAMYLGR